MQPVRRVVVEPARSALRETAGTLRAVAAPVVRPVLLRPLAAASLRPLVRALSAPAPRLALTKFSATAESSPDAEFSPYSVDARSFPASVTPRASARQSPFRSPATAVTSESAAAFGPGSPTRSGGLAPAGSPAAAAGGGGSPPAAAAAAAVFTPPALVAALHRAAAAVLRGVDRLLVLERPD